jgi:hypothetical protein
MSDAVWLTREIQLQKQFSDKKKWLPAGTCLFQAEIEHACEHLVYVYGAGCFDAVPITALSHTPFNSLATPRESRITQSLQ